MLGSISSADHHRVGQRRAALETLEEGVEVAELVASQLLDGIGSWFRHGAGQVVAYLLLRRHARRRQGPGHAGQRDP